MFAKVRTISFVGLEVKEIELLDEEADEDFSQAQAVLERFRL